MGDGKIKTYGDLKKIIFWIKTKGTAKDLLSVGLDVGLETATGLLGMGGAKTMFDFVKAGFIKPDTKKTNTFLDKLDVDDGFSQIVDDTVENGFLQVISKVFEDKPDDELIPDDFDMNIELQAYLEKEFTDARGGIKAANENKLRKYIREEIDNIANQAPPEDETSRSVTDLGNKFLQLAKDLKKGTYKGLDTSEIQSLDILVASVIQAMQDGSVTPLLQRMSKMIK